MTMVNRKVNANLIFFVKGEKEEVDFLEQILYEGAARYGLDPTPENLRRIPWLLLKEHLYQMMQNKNVPKGEVSPQIQGFVQDILEQHRLNTMQNLIPKTTSAIRSGIVSRKGLRAIWARQGMENEFDELYPRQYDDMLGDVGEMTEVEMLFTKALFLLAKTRGTGADIQFHFRDELWPFIRTLRGYDIDEDEEYMRREYNRHYMALRQANGRNIGISVKGKQGYWRLRKPYINRVRQLLAEEQNRMNTLAGTDPNE